MRPFRAEDGAMMYALNEDPEVLQYTGDVQFGDVAAASAFLRDYDQYEKYRVGRLVAILKETGETDSSTNFRNAFPSPYVTLCENDVDDENGGGVSTDIAFYIRISAPDGYPKNRSPLFLFLEVTGI